MILVKLFSYAYEYKEWIDSLNYEIKIINITVFDSGLIVTYKEN